MNSFETVTKSLICLNILLIINHVFFNDLLLACFKFINKYLKIVFLYIDSVVKKKLRLFNDDISI